MIFAPIALALMVSVAPDASSSARIETVAGTGRAGDSGDGGPADRAMLNMPFDVALDRDGNLYFSDTFNHIIRRIDAKTGRISTVAGSRKAGFAGDHEAAGACLGAQAGYWHATYALAIYEPLLTILLFSALAFATYQLSHHLPAAYERLAIMAASRPGSGLPFVQTARAFGLLFSIFWIICS